MQYHATQPVNLLRISEIGEFEIRKQGARNLFLRRWVCLWPLMMSISLVGCASSSGSNTPASPHAVSTTYSGDQEVVTYSDGSKRTYTATSNSVTWASDHIAKTTTYTFADASTNPVVVTVAGVAGTPTYSSSTQSIVMTYGDGTTATVSNAATSNAVTWAADHVTKTTTYTFADASTNPVVATVAGTVASADFVASAASYPANWTTTGLVNKPNISRYVVTYGDGFAGARTGTTLDPYAADVVSGMEFMIPMPRLEQPVMRCMTCAGVRLIPMGQRMRVRLVPAVIQIGQYL